MEIALSRSSEKTFSFAQVCASKHTSNPELNSRSFWSCTTATGVQGGCEHSQCLALQSQHSVTSLNAFLTYTKQGRTRIPKADPPAFGVDPPTAMLMKEQTEDVLGFQEHKLPHSLQLGFAVTWELTQNTRGVAETPQHTLESRIIMTHRGDEAERHRCDSETSAERHLLQGHFHFNSPLARSSLPASDSKLNMIPACPQRCQGQGCEQAPHKWPEDIRASPRQCWGALAGCSSVSTRLFYLN